jgi:hypothetical protein
VDDAASHGLLLVAGEQRAERRLAGDDERDHEAAVHVEVGEDAEHTQDVGAELVTLVELCGAPHNSTHVECLVMWSVRAKSASLLDLVTEDFT